MPLTSFMIGRLLMYTLIHINYKTSNLKNIVLCFGDMFDYKKHKRAKIRIRHKYVSGLVTVKT